MAKEACAFYSPASGECTRRQALSNSPFLQERAEFGESHTIRMMAQTAIFNGRMIPDKAAVAGSIKKCTVPEAADQAGCNGYLSIQDAAPLTGPVPIVYPNGTLSVLVDKILR